MSIVLEGIALSPLAKCEEHVVRNKCLVVGYQVANRNIRTSLFRTKIRIEKQSTICRGVSSREQKTTKLSIQTSWVSSRRLRIISKVLWKGSFLIGRSRETAINRRRRCTRTSKADCGSVEGASPRFCCAFFFASVCPIEAMFAVPYITATALLSLSSLGDVILLPPNFLCMQSACYFKGVRAGKILFGFLKADFTLRILGPSEIFHHFSRGLLSLEALSQSLKPTSEHVVQRAHKPCEILLS